MIDKLNDELKNDPLGRGYSGFTDQQAADDLNTVYRNRDKVSVSAEEMQQEVVASEYASLSQVQRDLWQALLTTGTIPVKNANIRSQVAQVWGANTATRANLVTLQTESISRATELGIGTVKPGHVAEAKP